MWKSGQVEPDEFWLRQGNLARDIRESFLEQPAFALANWTGPQMVASWPQPPSDGPRELVFGDPGTDENVRVVTTAWRAVPPGEELQRVVHDIFASPRPTTTTVVGSPLELTVDGVTLDFMFFELGPKWWIVGRVDDMKVTVETAGDWPHPTALQRVIDIEPYIEGRIQYLHQVRNDD
jgi:hypothetical protein